MTNLSWTELLENYRFMGLGDPNGVFSTKEYEEYDPSRQFQGTVRSFWGPRKSATSAGGGTQGRLKVAPYDEQWQKGYAFSLFDGNDFTLSGGNADKSFARQIPCPSRRKPTTDSDKSASAPTDKVFPHFALIYSPGTRRQGDFRSMADLQRKRYSGETEDPDVEDLTAEYRVHPCEAKPEGGCEYEAGSDSCKNCGLVDESMNNDVSWDSLNPSGLAPDADILPGGQWRHYDLNNTVSGEGMLKIEDIRKAAKEELVAAITDDEKSKIKRKAQRKIEKIYKKGKEKFGKFNPKTAKNLAASRDTVNRAANDLLEKIDYHSGTVGTANFKSLDTAVRNRIDVLMKDHEWTVIQNYIHERLDDGKEDLPGNAWIAWKVYNRKMAPHYRMVHFSIAAWVWGTRDNGKLDNELLQNIHSCYRSFDPDQWTPRDVLMVVEILRLMWWEKVGGDFEWTPLPANIVP